MNTEPSALVWFLVLFFETQFLLFCPSVLRYYHCVDAENVTIVRAPFGLEDYVPNIALCSNGFIVDTVSEMWAKRAFGRDGVKQGRKGE